MSGMHLVRGMTTISTKKRKQKGITAADRAAKVEHEKWLRKMGVHPEQLAKREKVAVNQIPNYKRDSSSLPTSDRIDGHCPVKDRKQYTGTLIKGIGTMHKSNAVPITSNEEAREIARMRRG